MSVIREAYRQSLPPNGKELAVLHVISELEAKNGVPPHLTDVARVYGVTRQAIHYWARRLRAKQLLEPGAGVGHVLGPHAPPLTMTDAGRLAVATSA